MAKPKREIFTSEGYEVLNPESSAELKIKIQKLENEIDKKAKENSRLSEENQDLSQEIAELTETTQSLSQENSNLIEEIRKLKAQVASLQNEVKKATQISSKDTTDEGIKARMAELEEENEQLSQTEKELREVIYRLKRRMGPLSRTAFENMLANRRFRR